jgi:hypothetical protein
MAYYTFVRRRGRPPCRTRGRWAKRSSQDWIDILYEKGILDDNARQGALCYRLHHALVFGQGGPLKPVCLLSKTGEKGQGYAWLPAGEDTEKDLWASDLWRLLSKDLKEANIPFSVLDYYLVYPPLVQENQRLSSSLGAFLKGAGDLLATFYDQNALVRQAIGLGGF